MEWLPIVAVVVVGLMVGVELSVAFVINPIVDGLPRDAQVLARTAGGRMLGRAMPPWYIGSTLLVAASALTATGAVALAWTSAAFLVASVVLSVAALVPINDRLKHSTPETAPDDWEDQTSRWDHLHLVRLALIVAAFVLITVVSAG